MQYNLLQLNISKSHNWVAGGHSIGLLARFHPAPPTNQPVDIRIYATVFIDYAGNNEFDIVIEDVRLEKLNIPFVELIFTPMTDNISQMLTDQLEAIGNFDLQDFSVEENYLEFSGTVSE